MDDNNESIPEDEPVENKQQQPSLPGQDKQEENSVVEPQLKPIEVNKEEIKTEQINVVVNVPKENNNLVNGIAIFSAIINLILAVLTYFLWKEAVSATNTATASLNETKRAVNESGRSNDIAEKNYNLAKETFDSSVTSGKDATSIAKKNAELQSKSVNAQIKSLEETRNRFDIENQPFLQFQNPTLKYNKLINVVEITYSLVNIRQVPVKVDRQMTNVAISTWYGTVNVDALMSFQSNSTLNLDRYYIKDYVEQKSVYADLSKANITFEDLYSHGKSIYIYTEIKYTNPSNGRRRVYKYGSSLHLSRDNNKPSESIFINENEDL